MTGQCWLSELRFDCRRIASAQSIRSRPAYVDVERPAWIRHDRTNQARTRCHHSDARYRDRPYLPGNDPEPRSRSVTADETCRADFLSATGRAPAQRPSSLPRQVQGPVWASTASAYLLARLDSTLGCQRQGRAPSGCERLRGSSFARHGLRILVVPQTRCSASTGRSRACGGSVGLGEHAVDCHIRMLSVYALKKV